MASAPTATTSAAPLAGGAYEILRQRLLGHARELRTRLDALNHARKEVFGSIELALLGAERITTEHNCTPRDVAAVADRLLLGYNVQFGLKTETVPGDVFSVYEFRDGQFHQLPLDLLADPGFERDFRELYRYYKDTSFAKFWRHGPQLYMVFRTGRNPGDVKTFKWVVNGAQLQYVDNRSDHEVRLPPQHDFVWTRAHRDMYRFGLHPHVSIEDRVFVETVGGDLTVKIENNTESGEGIYAEPVDNADQTLDDGEIYYAIVGSLILLKIRPYQEKQFRYLVFDEKTHGCRRVDAIESACVLLPDDQGLIFANGYYLQTGQHKTFDATPTQLVFERRIAAPNGEDYLYQFYNRDDGLYVLLPYNVIEQQVATPIVCHGATLFPDGEMVVFKRQDEPQKHHSLQVWRTPFLAGDKPPPTAATDSYLYRLGNRDIVRAMAECRELLTLVERPDPYAGLYVDVVKRAGDVLDSFFWLEHAEAADLRTPLAEIKQAATAAVDEFDKVVRLQRDAAEKTAQAERRVRDALRDASLARFDTIAPFVASLATLRTLRGEVLSLSEVRYVERATIERLEGEITQQAERLAARCVQFLLDPKSLEPYTQRVHDEAARIPAVETGADARKLSAEIDDTAGELEMLIDVVSNLKIDDATQRTSIIDRISAIFAQVNAARAGLKRRTQELLSVEGAAELSAQLKLLSQSVVNYLDVADTPDKCDELLTKLMVQVEELEGRFAEFDDFVVQLAEKRDEIYSAFESRKLTLVEARNRRAASLQAAATRILKGVQSRVQGLRSISEIHGYFAGDLMIEKVRDIVAELAELGDTVKVEDIQSQLKSIREDAVRQLKDRQELFVEGENVLRFGKHLFSVVSQALELTTVIRDGQLCLHLTGSDFFEPLADPRLADARDLWDQEIVSENRHVYRAEYLAHLLLDELRRGDDDVLRKRLQLDAAERLAHVQKFMAPRYAEGYVKGVHDVDAATLLAALLEMEGTLDLLRYEPPVRALATVYWRCFGDPQRKRQLAARIEGFAATLKAYPRAAAAELHRRELADELAAFVEETGLFDAEFVPRAAEYLFAQLLRGGAAVFSRRAVELWEAFHNELRHAGHHLAFDAALAALADDPVGAVRVLRDWVAAFLDARQADPAARRVAETVVVLLLLGERPGPQQVIDAVDEAPLSGLAGSHPRVSGEAPRLQYHEFVRRVGRFASYTVPRYEQYLALRKEVLETSRQRLKLDEFRPRVLSSFVRNKLIDSVYLPLIGDNLAKQIGAAGDAKRTDRMGLLLLVSPPGYGKTTLMEYVANRLGLIFMKINGPAIGHRVTSLDPAEAPNAAAREELHKLGLALEMGDNVMLYVDDIQHCHTEFLQKFISLCDAQRKIEGVYQGRTRTYDLRGRRVAVVMAGNPYTESGQKFQIPDMLSNRADVYNLGEIIGASVEAFETSYLENCLTSNPVLSQLASRSQKDVYAVIRLAQTGSQEGLEFEGQYSADELQEFVSVIRKLFRVRDVVLAVNREYIRSAAMSDDYRTEPPFKLQGSYRNMNRIAEKVLPVMNDAELQQLILAAYENDSQTLTSDAESNLLKFKELMGVLTPQESERWDDIRRTFRQNLKMRGVEAGDSAGMVIAQLGTLADGLDTIRKALVESAAFWRDSAGRDEPAAAVIAQLAGLRESVETLGATVAGAAPGDALRQFAKDMQATPAAAAVEQRVIVQHKVPRTVLEVVSSQFELLKTCFTPLLGATQQQTRELGELRTALEQTLARYSQLLAHLQGAERAPPRRGPAG